MNQQTGLFGKYRGVVVNNVDPLLIGRVQAFVPDVTGPVPTCWAMPCFPVNGVFAVPAIGAGLWIEFERGDADYPIWVGCYYGSNAELPSMVGSSPPHFSAITLETSLQNGIRITDAPGPTGGITIQSASGAIVTVNDAGIRLSNGKGASVDLAGPSVVVNSGALSVD